MQNILEHLPNPKDVLKGIANNLSPEAVGIIEVPNSDMLFSENLHSEFMLDHIFYFTRKNLINLIELCGDGHAFFRAAESAGGIEQRQQAAVVAVFVQSGHTGRLGKDKNIGGA